MSKLTSLIKKIAGIATALTTSLSIGCHMSEPKCYYGPAPMPDSEDNDLNPEVLEEDSDNPEAKPDYQNYPAHNSNEALDVYGPPPHELDDPDINPEMLEDPAQEPEATQPETKTPSDTAIEDYPKPNDPPVMMALYGVRMETKDK